MNPSYLKTTPKLYRNLINRREKLLTNGFTDLESDPNLIHPLNSLLNAEIAPIHSIVRAESLAVSGKICQLLMNGSCLFEILEKSVWHTPLIMSDKIEHLDETFDEVLYGLIKTLYYHFFILHKGNVIHKSGSISDTKYAYKPLKGNKEEYNFGNKVRVIDGFYIFIGKTPIIILTGRPKSKGEQVLKIFTDITLKEFPLKGELSWIENTLQAGSVKDPVVSISQMYDKGKSKRSITNRLSS